MAQLLALLTVFGIFSSLFAGKSDLYPNWSCKKGYQPETNNDESVSSWVRIGMSACEKHKINSPCYQHCIMGHHEIFRLTWEEGSPMNSQQNITEFLKEVIFTNGDNDSGERIAKSIVSKCGGLAKEYQMKKCSEGSKLFKCVESAWENCGK